MGRAELKKGYERKKDNQSSHTKDEVNQDLSTWKKRQLRRDRIEGYGIISSTDKVAVHFTFNAMKPAGCKTEGTGFLHACRKARKRFVGRMFKTTKICTGPRKDRTSLQK